MLDGSGTVENVPCQLSPPADVVIPNSVVPAAIRTEKPPPLAGSPEVFVNVLPLTDPPAKLAKVPPEIVMS